MQWRRHRVDWDVHPTLLEVAAEIDTNPFTGGGEGGWSFCFQTSVRGSSSALAMSVHSTYFDLATPLSLCAVNKR